MIYLADITTPANTLEIDTKKTRLRVTKGLVYRVEVEFPRGCAGLAHCSIFDGKYQVWPSTTGKMFYTDGFTIAFDDTYLKQIPPYEFTVHTYNLDEAYDHTIIIRLGLVSKEVFMARFLPTMTYDYFIKLLKQMQEEQAAEAENQKQEVLSNPFAWVEGE